MPRDSLLPPFRTQLVHSKSTRPLTELTSSPASLALWALIGYGLGSVMFGVLISRLMNLGDLRQIGSGNVGATNVLRTGNKLAAFGTLVLDGGKGAAAVLLARALAGGDDAVQVSAVFAFLGHCFPVWLGFRGGKGVATFLGLVLAFAWPVGIAACLTWLAAAAIWRYSSLAALCAAGLTPVWMIWGAPGAVLMAVLLAVLVFVRHSANIARLRAGAEPKIGSKSKA